MVLNAPDEALAFKNGMTSSCNNLLETGPKTSPLDLTDVPIRCSTMRATSKARNGSFKFLTRIRTASFNIGGSAHRNAAAACLNLCNRSNAYAFFRAAFLPRSVSKLNDNNVCNCFPITFLSVLDNCNNLSVFPIVTISRNICIASL